LIGQALAAGDLERIVVLKAISDATWFISNRDRNTEAIRWPVEVATAGEVPNDRHGARETREEHR
jgi:hypothetical protein